MAGKTPHEALRNFVGPLQLALSCIDRANVVYRPYAGGGIQALTTSEDPLRLRTTDRTTDYFLSIGQQYEIVETEDRERGPWKVSTRAYQYRIDDHDRSEIVVWHWHPDGDSPYTKPHLHASGPLTDYHLPTGRVSLESVVRFLLQDLGVRSLRDAADEILSEGEAAFEDWRTWA